MTRGRQNAGVCRRGFTLIELIVVISIVAILASIALMVGSRVMQRGRIVETGLTDQVLDDPQHPYTQLLVSSVLSA